MLKEFGQDLKKLRELKGISLSEISAESRINPKFLNFIESGIFDFQPETYMRSFLRAYAKALDENENQILHEYDKAKAGFYARRKFVNEAGEEVLTSEEKIRISVTDPPKEKTEEPVFAKGIQEDKPDYYKVKEEEPDKNIPNRSVIRKILIIVLIAAIGTGIYFLIDYLNNSGDKKTSVKPKTFNEISSEYENKISPKKDSSDKKDLTQNANDSLKLIVKALKDIKIKVYIDESKVIEENIDAKDSLIILAKDQFRFSATANQSVELYLNGKYLRKPASLSNNSIKNLVIKKDGIVSQ
jgi:cytoskeletal protein RodZ